MVLEREECGERKRGEKKGKMKESERNIDAREKCGLAAF